MAVRRFQNRIRVKLKSYDHRLLDLSARKIVEAVKETGADVAGPIPLPTERSFLSVIRSPHVHKDSREQFEIRVHKRLIDIYDANQETVDALSRLELPAGVEVEVKVV